MSSSRKRHAEYYLIQAQQQQNDAWFEKKWPQISRAAEWVCKSNRDLEFLFDFVFNLNPLVIQNGPWKDGLAWNKHAYKQATEQKDKKARLEALLNMAWLGNALGRRKEAFKYLRQCLALAKGINQKDRQASILSSLGAIDLYMGHFAKGRVYLKKSLKLREEIGDSYGKALSLNNLAESYLMQKRANLALPFFQRAKDLLNGKTSDGNYSLIINNLASSHYAIGSVDQALSAFEEALKVRIANRDLAGELSTRNNLAALHFRDKNYEASLEQLKKVLQFARALGQKRGEAIALNNIGYVYLDLNERSKATASFKLALNIATSIRETSVANTAREGIDLAIPSHQNREEAQK